MDRILRGLIATVAAIGALAAWFVVDSLAVFTDQELNAANTFTVGTLILDDSPDSAFITYAAMAPGDVTIQQLTLTNNGTMELRYAMTTSATNVDTLNLRDQLQLTLRTKTANPCSSEDGVILYAAALLSGGFFGSAAQGADAGDRVLAATISEDLCFKVELPLATGSAFQGATTTATFTFDAEQTANNP